MGFYLTEADMPLKEKAAHLILKYNAKVLPVQQEAMTSYDYSTLDDKTIVCVVDNGTFEAAGLAYDEKEFQRFLFDSSDYQRPRIWLIMEKVKAYELAGYEPN